MNITGRKILLWGADGGYDIYSAFFLYRHLVKTENDLFSYIDLYFNDILHKNNIIKNIFVI
jgi:hypothetical protein